MKDAEQVEPTLASRLVRGQQVFPAQFVSRRLLSRESIFERNGVSNHPFAIHGAAQHCAAAFVWVRGFRVPDHCCPGILCYLNHSRILR
jgi:hypothetical protein